jgi:hypothetical protein
VELIETSTFTRQITALLSGEAYGAIRVAVGSRGKRGGARVASADLTPKQIAQLGKLVKECLRDETENV